MLLLAAIVMKDFVFSDHVAMSGSTEADQLCFFFPPGVEKLEVSC